jgi:uncharacterized DUF497 family protein
LEFEWDDDKSQRTFQDRGFDGQIQGRLFVVVYTERAGRFRIISALRNNARDVQAHQQRRAELSLRSLELLIGAYRSARDGRTVHLP